MKNIKVIKKDQKKFQQRIIVFYSFLIILILFSTVFCYRLAIKKSTKITDTTVNAVEQVKEELKPTIAKKIVCLDPGHGGNDVGAIYGGIYESNINLTVAKQTKSLLEEDGYLVYLTRTEDDFEAKRDRATYCNLIKADAFVSIHHNSYPADRSVNYATALYYKNRDQLLASSVLDSTSEQLIIKSQGISKFNNSLLWVANMPATLIESFFMTNKSEYGSLLDLKSVRLADEAKGIATGINNYFIQPDQIKILISDDPLVIDRIDLE